MQDKFTRQAANALKLAKTTAQSCNHSYIGTEHILVGLLKEKEGTAGRILEEFNVEEDALRQLIEELIAPSEVLVTEKAPEYSPRALRVLERSVQEAENQKEAQAGKKKKKNPSPQRNIFLWQCLKRRIVLRPGFFIQWESISRNCM